MEEKGPPAGMLTGMLMHVAAVPPMARPRGDLVPSMISFKKLFDSALLRQSLVKDLFTSRVGILIIPRLPPPSFDLRTLHAEYFPLHINNDHSNPYLPFNWSPCAQPRVKFIPGRFS